MTSDEKQHLLGTKMSVNEKDNSLTKPAHIKRRIAALLLVLYLTIQPISIMLYVFNEWIQHTFKERLLSNSSVSLSKSGCESLNESSDVYKNLTLVQQKSAQWTLYNSLAAYIPAVFTSLILTAYTDKYGRKFLITLTIIGFAIKESVTLFVIYTNGELIYLILSSVVQGMTGSFYALFSASFSFVADTVKDSKSRVLAVIAVEFVSMLAVTVSGTLSGILVENLGFMYPTMIVVGTLVIAIIIALTALPETLAKENRTNPKSILDILKRPFEFYTSSSFKGKRLRYILFLLAFGVTEVVSLNRTSMETLYLLGAPFCWSPRKIGYFSSARHFGQGVVGLGSVKLMQRFMSNEVIAILSTVSNAASYIIEGLASTELTIYIVAAVAAFSFLTIPMIRGIMSVLTPPDKQGSMFASLASIQVLGSIIAVTTQNPIYSATVSIMNGFVFLMMAGICGIDFILLVIGTAIGKKEPRSDNTVYITEENIKENGVVKTEPITENSNSTYINNITSCTVGKGSKRFRNGDGPVKADTEHNHH